MSDHAIQPEIYPLGVDGVLVRFGRVLTPEANQRALAFRDAVAASTLPGVTEVVPSLVSVRVAFDPEQTDRSALTGMLQNILNKAVDAKAKPKRLWRIPAAFGPDHAPQLAEAAALAGLTETQAVAEITGQTLSVIAIGFAPGQPYLGMLPPHWDIPRQTTLTERMPSGALVAAVRQLIIFTADAPTGWRHIGQTAFQVYRPRMEDPFAFSPGDAVQFCQVSDSELSALRQGDDPDGGATCTVPD